MLRKMLLPALMMMATSASADQSYGRETSATQGVIGVEIGSFNLDAQKAFGESWGDQYDYSTVNMAVRLGAISDDYRLLGQYHLINEFTESGQTVKNYLGTVHLDYMFWEWDFGQEMTLKPFIGANGGYQEYKFGSISDDGITYGAETGLIFDFGRMDIDFGVRYMGSEISAINSVLNVYLAVDLNIEP